MFLSVSLPVLCLSAEGSNTKGLANKKPKQEKQRSRKDKATQHTFSHQLLAASLKVNWSTQWHCNTHRNKWCFTSRLLLQSHSFESYKCVFVYFQSHSANVTCLDFSSNGKYLASCADDRTVRIWSTKDFLEREHKCLRANVDLDHATLVRFSPDSRSPSLSYWTNFNA